MFKVEHDIIGMCGTNTYYAYDSESGKCIIVDPAGDYMRIFDRIKKLELTPVAILLTHGHFDHILAVPEVKQKYNIPVYIGEIEKSVIHDPTANLSDMFMGKPITIDADFYLKDEEEFIIGDWSIKALLTPGHTIGGMCYYFKNEKILFSGDTLFCESVGRSDFPGGSNSALCRSIKEKLFVLPDETKVYPGHMEETSIVNEKRYNPFCV